MANENLLKVREPDTQTTIEVDLRGHSMSTRSSGRVAPGNYEVQWDSAAWEPNRSGTGTNLHGIGRVLPSGVPIHIYHPAPSGVNFEVGMRFLKDLLYSTADGMGRLDQATAQAFSFSPAWLVGKRTLCRIEDETAAGYEGRSKIVRYLSKTEFDASPGADRTVETKSRPQTTVPEIGVPGNGSAAQKSLERVLGF